MLEEILQNPAIDEYLVDFKEGEVLCLEGDESQDLYILLSGRVEVLKGNKKISEVKKKGSSLGEMSFLLETKRTATLKAKIDVKAIRIPKDKITLFLKEFPSFGWEMTRILAKRLDEKTQAFYVLKEFCDELPDAVIAVGGHGEIISWNKAAEKLFGRTWDEMQKSTVNDIYEEPEGYKAFIREVQARYSVRERVLKVRHPDGAIRYISNSTTVLYDGHHNFKGVLSLCRDVTDVENLQRKYRRARFWLIPVVLLLGLIAAGFFLVYPRLPDRTHIASIKQQALRDQIAKDCLVLRSLLTDSFIKKDEGRIRAALREFFNLQADTVAPYLGIVLLDEEKKVFAVHSPAMENGGQDIVGSSYAGISFPDSPHSLHKVLILYRAGPGQPMGRKGVEIAFELKKDNKLLGWLLFQMDMDRLKDEFDLDEENLRRLQLQRP